VQTFRTVLEQKIKERRLTLEEFVEFAEQFARENKEAGTLSLRHLQRLISGSRSKGKPLGPLRPATARLLENIFGHSIDELLAPPAEVIWTDKAPAKMPERFALSGQSGGRVVTVRRPARLVRTDCLNHQPHNVGTILVHPDHSAAGYAVFFDWLDEHAGWIRDTARRKVTSRLAKLVISGLIDQCARRAKVGRSQLAHFLAEYYRGRAPGTGLYHARCGDRPVATSLVTRPDWLDLDCTLGQGDDRMTLVKNDRSVSLDEVGARGAVVRLAEAVALTARLVNTPIYRLLGIDVARGQLIGTVGLSSFAEYALTMDLLENEVVDAITCGSAPHGGSLPLRDRYLPDLGSVLDLSGRLCAGGALALCAIARPASHYQDRPDYLLLVQERSGNVINASRRLAVIPKAFHEPLTDLRADAQIGATLRREMEEELFGRSEVDCTIVSDRHAAAPMHPSRLSEPMRWLLEGTGRLRMECTGFGLNLVSGNYEFACLVVIEDEEFWSRYGGHVEANWESAGLRLYSSLDYQLLTELIVDEAWSNEGLFALIQGLRRLRELGGDRVDLPEIGWDVV
jgi:hypothetical protein